MRATVRRREPSRGRATRRIPRTIRKRAEVGAQSPGPRKAARTDDERIDIFMRSIHALLGRPYWPGIRPIAQINIAGSMTFSHDPDSGAIALQRSRLHPAAVDLAGAYMRKLMTGTDEVSIDNLIPAIRRKIGRTVHIDEAKRVWLQASTKAYPVYAVGDEVVEVKMDFPAEWKRRPSPHKDARELVKLTARDYAVAYYYDGFLHDLDPKHDTRKRKLVRSTPQVYQERMNHLAVSAALFVSIICHYLIGSARPDLCPDDCTEMAIMRGNARVITEGGSDGTAVD